MHPEFAMRVGGNRQIADADLANAGMFIGSEIDVPGVLPDAQQFGGECRYRFARQVER